MHWIKTFRNNPLFSKRTVEKETVKILDEEKLRNSGIKEKPSKWNGFVVNNKLYNF